MTNTSEKPHKDHTLEIKSLIQDIEHTELKAKTKVQRAKIQNKKLQVGIPESTNLTSDQKSRVESFTQELNDIEIKYGLNLVPGIDENGEPIINIL